MIGLTALLLPAAAQAAPDFRTDEGRLAAFLPIARAAWPNSPCAGRESVRLHVDIPAADYTGYGYGVYDPNAHALIDLCTIEIDDGYSAVQGVDPAVWCSMLVHDFGHLALGPDHSDDPTSIMYGEHLNMWAACLDATRPSVKAYVRDFLPAPASAWRITCTPTTDRHPRCRAQSHTRTLRFKILRGGGQVYGVEPA